MEFWKGLKLAIDNTIFLGWTTMDKIVVGALSIFDILIILEALCA